MREEDSVADIVSDIYETALDPSRHQTAIEKIVAFVGGVAGWVVRWDRSEGTGEVLYDFGCQPHFRQPYIETYLQRDPASAAVLSSLPGEVIRHSAIMSRSDFVKTRFYSEWMKPHGWAEHIFVTLASSSRKIAVLTIARSAQDEWADDSGHRRLRLILPHLQSATLVMEAIRQRTGQVAALSGVFNGITAPVFLVDAEKIIHANARGHALLAKGLQLDAVVACRNLREFGMRMPEFSCNAKAPQSETSDPGQSIAVPLMSVDGERYVAHCLPLVSSQRRTNLTYPAVAAVFLRKMDLNTAEIGDVIAYRYKLTPGELRVLLSIVETGYIPKTAARLGIAQTSVKTHLRRLFAKTGTTRQLELAKLVAGFSSAVSC